MSVDHYIIGGLGVQITSDLSAPLSRIGGFSLFANDHGSDFSLSLKMDTTSSGDELEAHYADFIKDRLIYSVNTEELGMLYHYSDSEGRYIFRMVEPDGKRTIIVIDCNSGGQLIDVKSNWDEIRSAGALRFSLWVAYSITSAYNLRIPIHSSTIVYDRKAVLFLGESGTGKSTHTKLWLNNIPGAFLLNDDCPIVNIVSGQVVVYGSPWSGKTPCYVNEHYPVAAFVRIVRAPYNKMTKLSNLGAFAALYPSCPPALANDTPLSDIICQILSSIIERVPVYRLECLPNSDAALHSFNTIFTDEQ